ncbi:hypothetical protein, partial [Actinomadura meridiana]|uniref:hypothetical protein n=1 Tax=Actinomadura meridiana TaxID=559626 RepID=UPI0031E7B1B9
EPGCYASKKSLTTLNRMATGTTQLSRMRRPGRIKALAFNTLLSSQETDTHRAGLAFAFPASG